MVAVSVLVLVSRMRDESCSTFTRLSPVESYWRLLVRQESVVMLPGLQVHPQLVLLVLVNVLVELVELLLLPHSDLLLGLGPLLSLNLLPAQGASDRTAWAGCL